MRIILLIKNKYIENPMINLKLENFLMNIKSEEIKLYLNNKKLKKMNYLMAGKSI